jgi:hypothetical protein
MTIQGSRRLRKITFRPTGHKIRAILYMQNIGSAPSPARGRKHRQHGYAHIGLASGIVARRRSSDGNKIDFYMDLEGSVLRRMKKAFAIS